MLANFQFFGLSHIGSLVVILASAFFLIKQCRKDENSLTARIGLTILTFLCFAIYPINQAVLSAIGGPHLLDALLPFHLCDIAAFVCGLALITRKSSLCEIAYFWGLAGTLQGLITPNLNHDFPSPIYLVFFFHHGIIVITALLLPLGLNWRPRPKAAIRAFMWLLLYAAVTFGINFILVTNFGFLMAKPDQASLLDIMGPWPWYILVLIGMAGILFYFLNLPFRKFTRKQPE